MGEPIGGLGEVSPCGAGHPQNVVQSKAHVVQKDHQEECGRDGLGHAGHATSDEQLWKARYSSQELGGSS